jgi:Zn finger protein HypA/HybF involved in hydrogenase expression
MNRKQRRAAERKRKKGDPEQLMADKVHMFGRLPESCDACQKTFDKKNRDMVFSWNVVVREDKVRLFCPECISKTKEVLDDYAQKS